MLKGKGTKTKTTVIEPLKKRVPKWRKDSKAIDKFKFVHHFLPHPEKKERAKLLSFKFFGLYIILIVFVMGLFRLLPVVAPGVLGYASSMDVKDLLSDTNKVRQENGLGELVINEQLSKAAHAKAVHMFENDYWAHVSPDGKEPWDFILGENYDYVYAGENLAKNFSNPDDVVKAWMESPSHRDNLLNSHYREIGFAVVNGTLNGFETTLVVQMFGQPKDMSHLATKVDSEKVLKEISTKGVTTVADANSPAQVRSLVVENKPLLDITKVTTYLSIGLAGFVLGLLVLDIWYSSKKRIFKFTGHTFAHVLVVVMAIASIWFVLTPGLIL
jgi:hypothetical protein